MEIKELNYLIAIYEERSISKAAERLYMAQSSLSQFLTTYESNLGHKLFVRTSNGVRPTEDPGRSSLTTPITPYLNTTEFRIRCRMFPTLMQDMLFWE